MTAVAIAMPRLGMTMEEGTIVDWPVAIGARVEKGDVVLVIETEKAETEIEATAAGYLRHVYVEPGETVPCGALLAVLCETAAADFDEDGFASAYEPPGGEPVRAAAPAGSTGAGARVAASNASSGVGGGSAAPGRKPVAPAARALAKKLDIDVALVEGSGPSGRVIPSDVEAYAAARERLVRVDEGVSLEVLREGSGEPVVLLPGFGVDVSSFALLTPVLCERFEVVGVNPRGVGASDAPDLPSYEVVRAAEDVAALVPGSMHVLGASLGAAVAIEFALLHPERVRSLTLITPFVEASVRLRAVLRGWCRAAAEASPDALAELLAPWLFGDGLLADEAVRDRTLRGLAQAVRRVPAGTLERSAAGLAAWSGSRVGCLEEVSAPTLIVAGGGDLMTPDAASIATGIPGATCELIPGCGHAVAIEAATRVAEAICSHLAST